MTKVTYLICIAGWMVLGISGPTLAQTLSGSVFPPQRPQLTVDFYKQNTTWNWQSRMFIADTGYSHWQYKIAESFQSNLLVPLEGGNQWKDEHNFNGIFLYSPASGGAGIYAKSWLQDDRQVSSKNQFGNHAAGLIAKYQPLKYLNFEPYAGYQQSKNRSKVDYGWDVGLKGELHQYRIGTYQADLDFASNYDFYDQRQNFENKFDAGLQTRFTDNASDSLSFGFSEVSKQYYSADSIRQVKIYNRDLRNKLFYHFSANDLFTVYTRLQSRDISYFNGRNVFYVENDLRYIHYGRKAQYGASLRTNDETQDNAGTITDSRTRQTALNSFLYYRFNDRKRLELDFAYVKLQYDTPDSIANNDDRDEQRFVFNIRYFHRFSSVLSMQWHAYAYLFHQIYIYKEQSVNNNWNRVIKLNPRVLYEYGRIRNRFSTQVLANFTIYDFEDRLSQTRSFVFRKYTVADSLTLRLFAENYAGIYARFELEDKGSFYDDSFTQQVLQSYKSQFFNVFLMNERFFWFNIKAGYTYYDRREWRHVPSKRMNRKVVNQGPYLSASYLATRRLVLSAYTAISNLKDSRTNSTRYVTGYLRLYYNI